MSLFVSFVMLFYFILQPGNGMLGRVHVSLTPDLPVIIQKMSVDFVEIVDDCLTSIVSWRLVELK